MSATAAGSGRLDVAGAGEIWTALRAESLDRGPLTEPAVTIFGKLAPGLDRPPVATYLDHHGRRFAERFLVRRF